MIMTIILTLMISEFGVLIDQKVPVAPSCRGTRPIYRSERGGRTGHREGALPNWSQVWGGIRGQMCPNPTHLTRPRTVNRRVKVASASAQWRGRIGGSALDAFSQLKSTLKVWKLVNMKLWYSDVVLHCVSSTIFIRPKSNHCLSLSVRLPAIFCCWAPWQPKITGRAQSTFGSPMHESLIEHILGNQPVKLVGWWAPR